MCLNKPVEFCLNGAKGRKSTIDVKEKLEKEIKILQKYFKTEMQKTYQLIMPDIPVTKFCNPTDCGQSDCLQLL